jgi:hypothetical protein
MEQTWLTWGGYYLLGFLGIFLHFGFQVFGTGGRRIADVTAYAKANSLAVVLSFVCYTAIVAIWISEGLEFFGMTKGLLSGLTIFVAYSADSAFKSIVSDRIKTKTDRVTQMNGLSSVPVPPEVKP